MITEYNISKVLETLFVLCSLENQDGLKSHYFLNVCGYCNPQFVVSQGHNTQKVTERLFGAPLRSLKIHQDLKVNLAGPFGPASLVFWYGQCFGAVSVLVQFMYRWIWYLWSLRDCRSPAQLMFQCGHCYLYFGIFILLP